MNRTRSTMIGTAVAIALFGPDSPAQAQQQLEEVVVSGIRLSNQKSLDAKRAATSVVEVITAEDIGKMPDKNVADSLARLPGVTTSSAGANEGGFDENDRVSMRGTSPSLTQTLLNGHNVASGDWFVLNQFGTVGRSVSYTLLPSELVDQVVVHKSSQASLVEGGVAGSVNIITPRPLDFTKEWTFGASFGAVYSELPDETDPQLNGLVNWKNEAGTIGVLVQAFSEERHLRRDGVEILGYETIDPTSQLAASNPDLAGVQYPFDIGAAFFEQERKRTGGLVDVEFRPSDDLKLDFQYFMSDMDAKNYNRNYLVWTPRFINRGFEVRDALGALVQGQAPDPGYVVRNNTLVSATFSPMPGILYGVYDQISRPDAKATSNYGSFEAEYRFSDAFSLSGQIGTSDGHGETPTQDVSETNPGTGNGASYTLHGLGRGPDFALGATDNTTPFPNGTPVDFNWIFGTQFVDVKDEEDWAKIDADFAVDRGAWTGLQAGVRYNEHKRESLNVIAQAPTFCNPPLVTTCGTDVGNYPTTFQNYPSDFNTFGGSIPTDVWFWTPEQLAAYNGEGLVQRDPILRLWANAFYTVEEKNSAAYVQANFEGSNWSGNVGLRYVQTDEHVITYTQPSENPDATTGSLFGPYYGIPVDNTYDDWLPSANLKWDITDDLVARFAVAKTMTRADYSALSGFTSLSPPASVDGTGTGSGGNPDLEPIRSTNYDAGLEWYFAERSLLSFALFYMDLDNYVGFGSETKNYLTFSSTFPEGQVVPYLLTVPVNASGRVQGYEVAAQWAINDNFGVAGNYTYADGKQTSLVTTGDDRLVGTSEDTYNLSGYFENNSFSARVTYTYRSEYFSGLDRNTAFSQDAIDSLGASLSYTFLDKYTVSLDGQNLNNPTLKYFALNEDQPRAFYKNGAQYYLSLRVRF